MAATLAEILNAGHARIEYVWYCAGSIWAAATSADFAASITQAKRKLMFGNQETNGLTPDFFWADRVDIYPILEKPGNLTITMKDGESALDGGTWTALINDVHVVPSLWNINNKRSIYGLEGLQAIATPRNDDALEYAVLVDNLKSDDTQIHIDDDWGGSLESSVNSEDIYVVYVGNEAIAVDGITAASGTSVKLDVHDGTNGRGILRTRPQSFFIDDAKPDIPVCQSMLYGLTGRPYYLFAFACNNDGTIIDGPAMVRFGKIGTRSEQPNGGNWEIQCLPWWKYLDTNLEIPDVKATLDRYVFARGPSASTHPPHMQIRETNDSGATFTQFDVYLCGASTTVMFANVEDFYDTVLTQVQAASTASGLGFTYEMSSWGPHYSAASAYVQMRGPLPFLFHWGLQSEPWQTPAMEMALERIAQNYFTSEPWSHPWWRDDAWIKTTFSASGNVMTKIPEYLYEWYWNSDTDYDEDDVMPSTKFFPIPVDPTSSNATLWIKEDSIDVSDMAVTDDLQIGAEDRFIKGSGYENPTVSSTGISALGSGGGAADENYIEIDSDPDFPQGDHECLIGELAENSPSTESYKKFKQGQFIYYIPKLQGDDMDPWPIRQNYSNAVSNLSTIFKALLGDTTDLTLPYQVRVDHIPESIVLSNQNMIETIDWDMLDELIGETADTINGVYFKFRYSGELNMWQLLQHELRFWGLTPTWEWSEDDDQYRIRFRRVGSIDATAAFINNRLLDNVTIFQSGTIPTVEKAGIPIYNSVDFKINYDPKSDKWGEALRFNGATESTGGKAIKIDIHPRITHINFNASNAEAELAIHLAKLLSMTQIPYEIHSVGKSSIKNLIAHGVGTAALVTVESVHNSSDGSLGLIEEPGIIVEVSTDLGQATTSYKYRLGEGRSYGWVPSVKITASHIESVTEIHVTDISGSGTQWTDSYPFEGWQDHWFFANFKFNETMTEPTDEGGGDYAVKLIEADTLSPTIITGLRVKDVTTDTYAASPAEFFKVYKGSSWTGSYDTGKDWIMVYDDYDAADIQEPQKKWVYQADSTGKIDASTPGNRWQ